MIKYIVDKGVELECQTVNGWRPLHIICRYSTPEMIRYIIGKGVNLDCRIKIYNKKNANYDLIKLIELNDTIEQSVKDDLINGYRNMDEDKDDDQDGHKRPRSDDEENGDEEFEESKRMKNDE